MTVEECTMHKKHTHYETKVSPIPSI